MKTVLVGFRLLFGRKVMFVKKIQLKDLSVLFFIGLLVAVLLGGSVPSVLAQENLDPLDTLLEDLLFTKLEEGGYLDSPNIQLMVLDINIENSYAIIGYYLADPENIPSYFSPRIALAYSNNNKWEVLENRIDKDDFNILLEKIPDTLLSTDSKVIYAYYPPTQIGGQATYSGHYLPWTNGVSYQVTQGPGGCGSHCSGSYGEFAWDFGIPYGGAVWASKSGTVAHVQENNATGTFSWNSTWGLYCTPSNTPPNYVVINHDQGASLYLHLKQYSVPSEIYDGNYIPRATHVGDSGNVGYVCSSTNTSTSGAHLHFQAESQSSSTYWTQSGSVDFSDWDEQGSYPVSGNVPDSGTDCNSISGTGIKLFDGTNCASPEKYISQTGFTNLPDFNDKASSIYVSSGWSVKVYQDNDKGGSSRCIDHNMWDLAVDYYTSGDTGRVINNDISSVEAYNNSTCSGSSQTGSWSVNYYDGEDHWWDRYNTGWFMCSETLSGPTLDKNYGSNPPCSGANGDTWIGDYKATINFDSGNYVFYAENDDGLRLYANDVDFINRGGSGGWSPICPARYLSGNVNLWAILREEGGDAKVKITWSTDTSVCTLPGSFNKIIPSNGASGQSSSPTLDWGSSSGALKYYYCIDTSNNNNCDTGWQDVGTATYKTLSGLSAGTTYYWQARANNNGGETFANSGSWWSFTVSAPVPNAPTLSSPGNGSTNPYDYDLTFQWNTASGATEYLVEWWGGPYSTMQPCGWSSSRSCSVGTVTPGHTYSWRVKARNSVGESGWSDTWSFTIEEEPCTPSSVPPSPGLVYPQDGSTISTTTPTLDWNDVSASYCVDFYQIQIHKNGSAIVTQNVSTSEYTIPSGKLLDGEGYAWYVWAHNSVDFGNYSGSSFEVAVPPSNDDFANATSISPVRTITLSTHGATQNSADPAIPNCNLNEGKATVWYKYTPTSNSAISLDTKTSSYDTFIAVWTGTRTNLSPVVCNDDTNGTLQSQVAFRVQADVTYYIEIGEFAGFYGTSAASFAEK